MPRGSIRKRGNKFQITIDLFIDYVKIYQNL